MAGASVRRSSTASIAALTSSVMGRCTCIPRSGRPRRGASTRKTATGRPAGGRWGLSSASTTRGRAVPEGRGSYESAGVSSERGERAVDLMRSDVEATHGPEVIGGPGGFAGLYALAGMRDPILASTIDGIGTKVLVAREMGRFESLGAAKIGRAV